MTRNQILYHELVEKKRANRASEELTRNRDTETAFHNRQVESISLGELGVSSRNADTNWRNAQTNVQNAQTNALNAATNVRNAESNALQARAALSQAGTAAGRLSEEIRFHDMSHYLGLISASNDTTRAEAAERQSYAAEKDAATRQYMADLEAILNQAKIENMDADTLAKQTQALLNEARAEQARIDAAYTQTKGVREKQATHIDLAQHELNVRESDRRDQSVTQDWIKTGAQVVDTLGRTANNLTQAAKNLLGSSSSPWEQISIFG